MRIESRDGIVCFLAFGILLHVTAIFGFPSYDDRYSNGQLYNENDIMKFIQDVYRTESRDFPRNTEDWEFERDPYPRGNDVDSLNSFDYPESSSSQDSELGYGQVLNALQTMIDDDEEKNADDGTKAEVQPDEIGDWDEELQSEFSRDEDMRQKLLLASYLEDVLGNEGAKGDWSTANREDDVEDLTETDTDETKELVDYSKDHILAQEDALTSDGKKERNNRDKKSEAGMKEDPEDSRDATETAHDIQQTDDQTDQMESPHFKDDVDELRSLLTEMIDSSRKESGSEEMLADDVTKAEKNLNIKMEVKFPGVSVSQNDTYLCTYVKIPNEANSSEPIYIEEYIPHAKQAVAHHMLMYGCGKPGMKDTKVWNCGGQMAEKKKAQEFKSGPLCGDNGQQTILWAWAKDAPLFKLPNDVGFKVGGLTNIHYLVLQVHYKSASVFKGGRKDYSGVTAVATKTKKPRLAGVYIMASSFASIPPHSKMNFDIQCEYKQSFTIHPFAFRTHTHALGVEVLGFRIRDGDWTLIGAKNPQLPEAFYPVAAGNMTIRYNDWLAARCRMNNFRDVTTSLGFRHTDEMCNFYIMFWVESKYETELDSWTKACSNGFPWIHWRDLPGFYN